MVVASVAAVLVAAAVVTLQGKRRGAAWAAFVRRWSADESVENHPGARSRATRRADGVLGAIGNTPLIRIQSLSDATGCDV